MTDDQVLTVAQMQAAEQAIFDAGTSIETLMDIAGSGAADWIRRVAAAELPLPDASPSPPGVR